MKRQTIRADRKRHARPGEEVQLYTAMRTKHCKLIGRATCESMQDVVLYFDDGVDGDVICVNGTYRRFAPYLLDEFARADGFADWAEMKAFWRREHPGVDRFEGVLIKWGDLQTESQPKERKSDAKAENTFG